LFADIDDSMTLCPDDLAQLLDANDDVGAVFAVHTYGLPAKVDELQGLVNSYGKKHKRHVPLLFDAAHAFGSAIGNRRVGSFGDAEIFSLSVTKALVSIEGGLVTSKRPEIIERVKKMRNYGIESNYETWYPGMNGKMSEFHGIVGLANLKKLDERLASRAVKAQTYRDLVESRTPCRFVPLPEGVTHTWKDVTVMLPRGAGKKRPAIMAALQQDGVETRPYFYPAVHQQKYFKHLSNRPLPVTEDLSTRCVTLPNYTAITDDEMAYVADRLALACKRSGL